MRRERAAGRHARTAATETGLRLGAIVSVSETSPLSYYGPSFYDAALGTFGPGRFCGIYRRPVFRRNPRTGLPRVVRRVAQRRCNFPTSYGVSLEVRYEADQVRFGQEVPAVLSVIPRDGGRPAGVSQRGTDTKCLSGGRI